jgi:hypothetical protein
MFGRLKRIISGFIRLIVLLFEKFADYTGPFAAISKGFLVGGLALFVFSPFIIYTSFLMIAQSVNPAFSYVLFTLWLVYLGFCMFFGGLVGYAIETKGSSWLGPKSLDYERQKGPKLESELLEDHHQEVDIDERVRQYLETLEKTKNKR